jgi:nucleoside-diphosphate-sugar epimerase
MFSTAKVKKMHAVVLGGSGQVGSKLVASLQRLSRDECEKITLISRRPLDGFDGDDRVAIQVVDYDKLGDASVDKIIQNHNAAFMLMGVGQPRKASQEEVERIDADIPIRFSEACTRNKVEHMSVLSAYGADPKATYSSWTGTGAGGGWYNYCKGKMEEGIKAFPFASVVIFEPAGIYPGNSNTPSLVGQLNAFLNPILPGAFETASSEQIADSMVQHMKQQLARTLTGHKTVIGGKAIKDSLD